MRIAADNRVSAISASLQKNNVDASSACAPAAGVSGSSTSIEPWTSRTNAASGASTGAHTA